MSEGIQLTELTDAIAQLSELSSDSSVPRNVRSKLQEMISVLQSTQENSIKIHEALNVLDDLSNDLNLDSFTRTQLYSIIGNLEKLS